MPTSLRSRASALPSAGSDRPSNRISPELIGSSRLIVRHSVDLPEPDGPTTTTTSPRSTDRLTSRSTCNSPNHLLTRSSTISGSPVVIDLALSVSRMMPDLRPSRSRTGNAAHLQPVQKSMRGRRHRGDGRVERLGVVRGRPPEPRDLADVLERRRLDVVGGHLVGVRRAQGLDAAAHGGDLPIGERIRLTTDMTTAPPTPAASGPVRTYEVRTYGCQMNVHDSERISGLLEDAGYVRATGGDQADVVVFNTCAVRENADNKLYGNLGHLAPVKAARPGMQIA